MPIFFFTILITFFPVGLFPSWNGLVGPSSLALSEEHETQSDMVLLPAGVFEMGTANPQSGADERPRHMVSLNAFYLDKYEVTNREFRKFVTRHKFKTSAEKLGKAWVYVEDEQWTEEAGAWWKKPEGRQSVFATRRGSHPVVMISWDDAKAYCEGVGKR